MKHFLLACFFPMTLTAETMQQLTEQLGKTVLYSDVALSPDRTHVAWVQSTAATTSKQTHVRGTSGNATAMLVKIPTTGERTDFDPTWSPDSKTLAVFSSAGDKEQRQLWTVNADGSDPKEITNLKGYAARPRWSHNGKQIAFLFVEGAGGGGPLMAAPTATGVIDTAIHNQRIAVLDIAMGQLRQVSPVNLHIYDYDWSPDDKTFVATAAPGPGDNNWWIAQIYTIDIAKGNATSIYKPSLQLAVPRWSPDGKSIAFIEGLMSDEGFHGGDLFTISAAGHSLTNRTRGRKSSASSLFWLASDRILFTEYVGGGSAISELTLADNSVRTIWKGAEHLHAFGNFPNFAVSRDGKFAAAERSTFETPPEMWAGPIGDWHQLTSNNSGITASWGKAENLEWTNDSFNIQGWLLSPAKVESGQKYPIVVLIHGGPSSAEVPEWPASFGMPRAIIAALSSRGYYVLMPNPRGSYGQGEEFTRANVKDFGAGDLRDILAGVDAAIKSYYGQNLIDQWMIPFFGASVYDNPAVYEKSSPIHYIKKVKTPTLVIVGERDAECPSSQSYEFWHALKTLGVPTQLIVYPGEGHLFIKPANQADRMDQTVAWFDKYLK